MSAIPFSFILPAFKIEYLREAIESILKQTYAHFELIIVNDKSPYDVKAVVESFTDSRIRYYENAENMGGKDLVAHWNNCLQYATGEWVIMASDDDIYEAEYLNKMDLLIREYPHLSVFHCRFATIDAKNKVIAISQPCLRYETAEEFIFNNIIERRRQVLPNFIFRKSKLDAIGGFVNLPLAWGADDATSCRLALEGGVGYCDEILFSWRFSGENISSRQDNLMTKLTSRLLLYDYFNKQIVISLKEDNIISEYYKKITISNLKRAIQREIVYSGAHSKSLSFLLKVVRETSLRKFLGLKNILMMSLNLIYLKYIKR